MRLLSAGECWSVNTWNRILYTVSPKYEDVYGFVLWTSNSAPFYVQYTVTGYPHALERSVVTTERAITHMWNTTRIFEPFSVIRCYDLILVTTFTPIS